MNKINLIFKNNAGVILPLLVFAIIMVMWSFKMPMVADEYCFYKLSLNFPNYSSTGDWFLKDHPSIVSNSIQWDKQQQADAFHAVYDDVLYPHVPLMPMVFSPIVKGLNFVADKGIIPHLEDEAGFSVSNPQAEVVTKILRSFSIVVLLLSLWLIYKLLYKKVGKNAVFFAVPLAASYQLIMGAYLFYWDVFMMFFFVLTLYLMEKKSKWAYLTACFMVNTKMFVALAFLIPLAIKNWKMILMGFSILPWFGVSWIVTGSPFYFFVHYLGVTGTHDLVYQLYSAKDWILILVGLGIPFFVVMTFPIVKYVRKYPEYVALLIIGTTYAFAAGLGITHLSTLIYVGCLIFPIVAYEFKLSDRIGKLMGTKAHANISK